MTTSPASPELHTGMQIGMTDERKRIFDITDQAHRIWSGKYVTQEVLDTSHAILDKLAEIDGIDIIAHGGYAQDYLNRCGHYAFGTEHGNSWAMPGEMLERIWGNGLKFLAAHDYQVIDVPAVGDIAGWSNYPLSDPYGPSFQHFGIVLPEGRMRSKFGPGPIVEHGVHQVPADYGEHLIFLGNTARQGVLFGDKIV